MDKIKGFLFGKKTIIVAIGQFLAVAAAWSGDNATNEQLVTSLVAALVAITGRAAIKKVENILVAIFNTINVDHEDLDEREIDKVGKEIQKK